MSEWIKNYVLSKSSYFINYDDVREKIEIKCKEIESICEKYSIDNKIKVFDKEAHIIINNQELDTITWKIADDSVILRIKNKEANILLNGMNTYSIIYKGICQRRDTIDKAIDYALEKLLN